MANIGRGLKRLYIFFAGLWLLACLSFAALDDTQPALFAFLGAVPFMLYGVALFAAWVFRGFSTK